MNIADVMQKKLQSETFNFRYGIERISAELKFAEGLKNLLPENAASWEPLIASAAAIITTLPQVCNDTELQTAIQQAEELLAPLAESAKHYTVHCVGHAHIDMNWMWSWPETVAATNDTFNTVLRLMDEFPGFTFSQSQASVYAIIEEFNPEMLAQIRRRVTEKRWEITASHWVENDKNMAGGEALSRHLLQTRRYMHKLFGLGPEDVNIDWAPDTFGQAATTPAYLTRGGIKYCYLHRPGNATNPKPAAFWWQSPDGSRILARNDMKNGYNGRVGSDIADKMLDFVRETGGHHFMFVYGIGDHGGGPTRCDLNRIVDMASWPIFPQIKFSTARAFFDALSLEADALPVINGELNVEFTGCYTTQTQIKKANRHSENLLADAEFAASLGWRLRQLPYPAEKLENCWRKCLFTHFHDILPGSGVRATRHYTMGHFQDLQAATGMIETLALRQLAAMVDTKKDNAPTDSAHSFFSPDTVGAGVGHGSGNGGISAAAQSGQGDRPFVIFNPTETPRREIVETTIWDNPLPGDCTELKDRCFTAAYPDGRQLPAQFLSSGNYWGHRYVKLAIPVEVAGFGYTTCAITETPTEANTAKALRPLQPPHHCPYAYHERAARFGGSNQFTEFEINPHTGGIMRLRDIASGLDLITPDSPSPLLEFSMERPRDMSAWTIGHGSPAETPRIKSIIQEAAGPYLLRVKVTAEIRRSRFTIQYELAEGNPMLAINIHAEWLESGNRIDGTPSLRLPLALHLDAPDAEYEIPFGAVKRDFRHDEEVPALQWVKISDHTGGILLVNDCKYGFALDGNTLRASLIRSSYEPDPYPELGEHEMRFGLLPFSGKLSTARAANLGRDFNHPLKVVATDRHAGTLPPQNSLVRVAGENIVVSGLKKAEDADALVIRFYETAGMPQTARIAFHPSLGAVAAAEYVDLMEQPLSTAQPPNLKDNLVEAAVAPFDLVSLKISFAGK